MFSYSRPKEIPIVPEWLPLPAVSYTIHVTPGAPRYDEPSHG